VKKNLSEFCQESNIVCKLLDPWDLAIKTRHVLAEEAVVLLSTDWSPIGKILCSVCYPLTHLPTLVPENTFLLAEQSDASLAKYGIMSIGAQAQVLINPTHKPFHPQSWPPQSLTGQDQPCRFTEQWVLVYAAFSKSLNLRTPPRPPPRCAPYVLHDIGRCSRS
jgi:hypothetical protein